MLGTEHKSPQISYFIKGNLLKSCFRAGGSMLLLLFHQRQKTSRSSNPITKVKTGLDPNLVMLGVYPLKSMRIKFDMLIVITKSGSNPTKAAIIHYNRNSKTWTNKIISLIPMPHRFLGGHCKARVFLLKRPAL